MFRLKNTEACYEHFNFFFLNEYKIDCNSVIPKEQLLEFFIHSRHFIQTFSPSVGMETIKEFPVKDIKAVATYTFHGPFIIEHIKSKEFKIYKGRQLKEILQDYSAKADFNAGEGIINNFRQSLSLVEKYNIEEDDLFYLNKEWFKQLNGALADFSSIYDYYLLFIAISPDMKRLIVFDYGAD